MVAYCMTTRTCESPAPGAGAGLLQPPGPSLPPRPADYTPTRLKVSKSCVPTCFETVYDGYSKHASTTSCCQYDLCNGASPPAPAALVLAPALLAAAWELL
ncbi:Ly-6/neurotoxin-like protein 1 [Galemys pyrenaicus]|uniref:Ly-6/neurotoxin-like protein 1 n=1 Tax=Galemys pyrenaicus TaxID=202257 RepID=A0A8J6A4P1_GALPY|nr:Ly-6/neurotoxin-like protein 1 [Galemys pyrenaicus]